MDEIIDRFVRESNVVEGIFCEPTKPELEAHKRFLSLDRVEVSDLEEFVSACEPGAKLRAEKGMDVRVGNHFPLPGGSEVAERLEEILGWANGETPPWDVHCEYEHLHPFIDCNGRSGRVLWAWQQYRQCQPLGLSYGFLQAFYYQTLEQHEGYRGY